MQETQIAVIGGGPAGLQAAMSIGRVHRDAVLFDSGRYRNASVVGMHNLIGFDGVDPAEFRARAQEQIRAYPTVTIRDESVVSVTRSDGGFVLEACGGAVRAQALVLATGVRDILPDIPGLAELWGTRAGQCPFCHGHEFADKPVAILGAPTAAHYAAMMRPITHDMTVLTDGVALGDGDGAVLADLGAEVRTERVVGLEETAGGVRVNFDAGEAIDVAGVFLHPGMEQAAPFASQLGLTLQESGAVAVDEFRRTSVDGVFAAGDMAHTDPFPMPMASVANAVASGQQAAVSAIRWVG